jgi:hypothetical protein
MLSHGYTRMHTDKIALSVFIRVHPWPNQMVEL